MKNTLTLGIIVGLMTILSTAAIASCPDSMVSYWKFDDGTATDTAGNNDGTINGATQTAGKLDSALDFDGSDDYVDTPFGQNYFHGWNSITISLWVKTTGGGIIAENTEDYDGQIRFRLHSGELKGAIYTEDGWWKSNFDTTIYDGNWHFVIYRYESGELSLWIDGQKSNSHSVSGSIVNSDTGTNLIFRIGGDYYGQYLDGSIDEVAIYNEALSEGEVAELYEASANKGKGYCNVEPTATNFSGTNLSEVEDLTNVSNLELQEESSDSKVKWNNNINVVGEDLDKNVKIDPSFVSLNASSMDSTFNSSANVTVNVASCDDWSIYYANQTVDSLNELKTEGSEVGGGSGLNGICDTDYCSNPTCSNGVLTYTVEHFDSTGGDGTTTEETTIPEFNWVGMILIVAIAGIALYFISNRKR